MEIPIRRKTTKSVPANECRPAWDSVVMSGSIQVGNTKDHQCVQGSFGLHESRIHQPPTTPEVTQSAVALLFFPKREDRTRVLPTVHCSPLSTFSLRQCESYNANFVFVCFLVHSLLFFWLVN